MTGKAVPTLTTNPDGSTRENTCGCGCAGGEVVTVRDEAGRRRKLTMDIVVRLSKVEELKYDQTIYSTTNHVYNVRDQITSITQQSDRVRTFNYDGHGRLSSKTTPEQGTISYSYYNDDLMQTVTDARGAKSTFNHNGRHLPTSIAYDLSGVIAGQSVTTTPNVSFGYDAAGNRTS